MKVVFDDAEFDGQLQRATSKAYERCSDIGECLATAQRIQQGDYDSWYDQWWATAEKAQRSAEASKAVGHEVSAREAYLRACEYYRSAYFFRRSDLDDPKLLAAWRRQRECFRAAAAHFEHPCEAVEIPYEGTTLSGYFLRPDDSGELRATIVAFPGYDAPVEESYPAAAAPALRRGYSALLFDGPGQASSLYEKRLYFRPDYEVVLKAVVDYAVSRPEVDAERIALIGRSFGGLLAPRAATGEHRFAALIADPGQYDLGEIARSSMPKDVVAMVEADDPAVDEVFAGMLADPHRREYYGSRMATFGANSMREFLRMLSGYTVRDRAGRISCPTLVTGNEADPIAAQARQLYDALECPKEFVFFTEGEGAGGHCEGLGQSLFSQRSYDWLDDVLAAVR
jgi:dienelactone hydrolase